MKMWLKLPEWSRWVLCWPVIFVSGLLASTIIKLFFFHVANLARVNPTVTELISPVVTMIIYLPILFWMVVSLVPRKQHYVVGVWCFSTAVVVLACVFALYMDMFQPGSLEPAYKSNGIDEVWYTLRDLIGAGIGLCMGVYYFNRIRKGDGVLD